jgi:hypothetical protein
MLFFSDNFKLTDILADLISFIILLSIFILSPNNPFTYIIHCASEPYLFFSKNLLNIVILKLLSSQSASSNFLSLIFLIVTSFL